MAEKREAPLSRLWKKTKQSAPRQKVIASTIATVRRAKPGSEDAARAALVAEAAKQGVADLSDKELRVMIDAVTTSVKEAASQAVTKGVSGVKSLWSSLQTSTPDWIELPDDVAAFNIRSDQTTVAVTLVIDDPDVVARLLADLPADNDGTRSFNCWLTFDGLTQTAFVHVGKVVFGRVPSANVDAIRHVITRRRAWTPATLHGSEPAGASVTIDLPDGP